MKIEPETKIVILSLFSLLVLLIVFLYPIIECKLAGGTEIEFWMFNVKCTKEIHI